MEKVFIIHSQIAKENMSEALRQQRAQNTRYMNQLFSCLSRVEYLMDKAYGIVTDPDNWDYVEEVPTLMSELYLNYLRIGAIRQRLDPDMLSKEAAALLPSIWEVQAAVSECLDVLTDIFGEEGVFEDEDRNEDGEGEEDGENLDDDILCTASFKIADCVPEEVAAKISEGISKVIADAFEGLAISTDSGD